MQADSQELDQPPPKAKTHVTPPRQDPFTLPEHTKLREFGQRCHTKLRAAVSKVPAKLKDVFAQIEVMYRNQILPLLDKMSKGDGGDSFVMQLFGIVSICIRQVCEHRLKKQVTADADAFRIVKRFAAEHNLMNFYNRLGAVTAIYNHFQQIQQQATPPISMNSACNMLQQVWLIVDEVIVILDYNQWRSERPTSTAGALLQQPRPHHQSRKHSRQDTDAPRAPKRHHTNPHRCFLCANSSTTTCAKCQREVCHVHFTHLHCDRCNYALISLCRNCNSPCCGHHCRMCSKQLINIINNLLVLL